MSKYIEEGKLLDFLDWDNDLNKWVLREVDLDNLPIADVVPVVHGQWEYDQNANDWGIGGYICSVCKNKNNNLPSNRIKSVSSFSGAKYCPNCGAKMDGE